MLNCRAGFPERQGALPLSYGRMVRPAGFEPATTRMATEVSDIFTTESVSVCGWAVPTPQCWSRGTVETVLPLSRPHALYAELRAPIGSTEGFAPSTSWLS